jgi:hypothetical protein
MSKISCLCALTLLSISHVELEAACTNTWNTTTGNWGSTGQTANWAAAPPCVPGEPGSATDVANFTTGAGGTITLANLAGSADVSPTLNMLNVTNSNYIFQQRGGGAGVLQLTTTPSVTLTGSSSTVNTPVSTNSATSINLDPNSELTFGASSNLTGTTTLNVNTTGSNTGALTVNSATGIGNNMSIVLGAPGGNSNTLVTNTGIIGSASPSITLNDQSEITNNSPGTIGSSSTAIQMGRSTLNNQPGATFTAESITMDGAAFPHLFSGTFSNGGTLNVANTLSITNSGAGDMGTAVDVISNNQNTVTTGNGATFTVGDNLSFDTTSVFVIQNLNEADVTNGAGGSIGAYFQVNGTTPGTFTVHGDTQIGNNNQTLASNTITAGNTGVFFDGTNADLVYSGNTLPPPMAFNSNIQSYNNMDIVGGGALHSTMGSRMEFRSFTMTSGFVHVENASPGTMSGNGAIGTLFRIHNDVLLMGDISQPVCSITVENDGNITGTNNIGNWFDMTNGNLDLSSITNAGFLMVCNGTIDGAGNIGSLLSLDVGNLTIPSGNIFALSTSATVQNGSTGSELLVNGTFQTSGDVLNLAGLSVDAMSIGNLIRSPNHPIQVLGGYFINNDHVQTDNVPVSSGAVLGGTGIYQGATVSTDTSVVNDGTVYPGVPPVIFPTPTIGTMTIDGTYTQNPDGTLFINIENVGSFSQVKVLGTGTADLQGTVTVAMVPGAVITASDTYNILETLNGITNASLNPTVILDPSYTSTLSPQIRYITGPVTLAGVANPNIVQLYFMQLSPTTPSVPLLTSYSFSFETLFDLINRDNLILEREMQRMRLRYQREYVVSTKKSSSRRVAQSNTPRAHISFDQPSITTVANKTPGNSLAFARYRNEIEQQRMGYSDQDRPWNFFIGPVGDVGTIKTKQNQIGSDYWSAGGLTSFNYVFSQGGIGLFADYNKVKADVHRHWGNFNFDMAHSCLYGTYSPKQAPDLAFHSIVGGSYEWYTINRKTTTTTAKGKTHGSEFDALFTGEYVFAGSPCSDFPEHFTIIPRAGVQYIYVDGHRYKEHGAGTSDLKFHNQHAKSLRSIVDLWMKYSWEWTNVKFAPELNIGWQREFFDHNRKIFFTPIALPTSSVRAFGAGQNTYLAGLDLFLEFYEKYALEASYDFQWNSLIRDNGFYLGFHARF